MSLRPLAEAIGSSPRVLLYLYGSKDELIRALLDRARSDELAAIDAFREVGSAAGLAGSARQVWEWLSAPGHRLLLGLWVEGHGRSLVDPAGPWAGFAAQTVQDWLGLLGVQQPPGRRRSPGGRGGAHRGAGGAARCHARPAGHRRPRADHRVGYVAAGSPAGIAGSADGRSGRRPPHSPCAAGHQRIRRPPLRVLGAEARARPRDSSGPGTSASTPRSRGSRSRC